MAFERDAEDDNSDALPESVTAWLGTNPEQRAPAGKGLSDWLARDPNNAAALEDFDKIWRLSQTAPPPAAWAALRARMDMETAPPRVTPPRARPAKRARPPYSSQKSSTRTFAFAASAVVILGIGAAATWSRIRPAVPVDPKMTTLTVPAAAMSTVQLAGGVRVRLNSVSTLSYSVPRDGVQEVRLDGEGYFDVPHNPGRVFRVVTEMGTVTDLGTQFNINARSGKVAVTVVDGAAQLESAGETVSVRAGQTSYALKGAAPVQPRDVNVGIALAWTEGRLVFRDEPLEKVAEAMTRRYGVPFSIDDELRDFKISAAMTARESGDAAAALCAAASARCVRVGSGWSIRDSAK